ncbi:helix-turn-helix domain-containing protein [Actinomadura sp. SCN-SB]|uniref:helix-turn-helix domain-containing protein n=1 Tax=Actinomadura sp. SCN-SB TaxID=3373092 RepID=UPI003753C1A8
MVDLVTAGRVLGLGRTKTYQLARAGEFPCRIIRVGKSYLVPTAELLALLGLDPAARPQPHDRPHTGPNDGSNDGPGDESQDR